MPDDFYERQLQQRQADQRQADQRQADQRQQQRLDDQRLDDRRLEKRREDKRLDDRRWDEQRWDEQRRDEEQRRANERRRALSQMTLDSFAKNHSKKISTPDSTSKPIQVQEDKSSTGTTILKAGIGLLAVAAGWWLTHQAEQRSQQSEITSQSATKTCVGCGSASTESARFCTKCGKSY